MASNGWPTRAHPPCRGWRSPGRPPPTTAWRWTWTPYRTPCTASACCSPCPPEGTARPASAPWPPPSSPSRASTATRSPATPSPAWRRSPPSSRWSSTDARAPGRCAPSAKAMRAASPISSPTRTCPRPTGSPGTSRTPWPAAWPVRCRRLLPGPPTATVPCPPPPRRTTPAQPHPRAPAEACRPRRRTTPRARKDGRHPQPRDSRPARSPRSRTRTPRNPGGLLRNRPAVHGHRRRPDRLQPPPPAARRPAPAPAGRAPGRARAARAARRR